MTITAPAGRDTRIDVLRALALLTIYIDHVPGTIFEHLTYKNFGFSDAAEAFVLISGMSVALAYGGKFQPGNRLFATLKMWRRTGVLYASHVVASVVSVAIFCAAGILFKRPDLLWQNNIGALITNPPEALLGLATLGHQIGYNNILSLYAVLLFLAPAVLLVAGYGIMLVLTLSGGLWLIAGLWQIAPTNYPEPGFWFLNPLSWQFLFAIGMVSVLHVRRGGRIPVNRWLVSAASIYVAAALIWVHSPLWGKETWFGLPAVLTGFDKSLLSLPRLLHILAVSYLVVAIPAVSRFFRRRTDHPLAILGKRSLPVFIAGTIIAMMAQVIRIVSPGNLLDDTLLIVTGIAMQFALAYYLEWVSRLGWSDKVKPARDRQPVGAPAVVPLPAMTNVR